MILLLLLLLLVIVGESDSVFFENGGVSKTLPRREGETGKRPLENPSLAKGKKKPTSVRARGRQCLRLLPPPRHVRRREKLLRRLLDRVLPPVEPVRGPDDAREGAGAQRPQLAELCRVA